MKKYLIIALIGLFAVSGVAFAQTSDTEVTVSTTSQEDSTDINDFPDVVITSDSPFFFLKRAFERVGTFFAFGQEAKANRYLELANRRLAEAQKMAENGSDTAGEAIEMYKEEIEKAREKAEGLDKTDVIEKITTNTNRHIEVLQDVLNRVPEEAKSVIQQRIEEAKQRQEELINKIESINPNKAGEVASDVLLDNVEAIQKYIKERNENKIQRVEESTEQWREYIDEVLDENSGVAEDVAGRMNTVLEAINKFREDGDWEQLPDELKARMENMKNQILKNQLNAIKRVGDKDPEKSAELMNQFMEKETERIQSQEHKDDQEYNGLKNEIMNSLQNSGLNVQILNTERTREQNFEGEDEAEGETYQNRNQYEDMNMGESTSTESPLKKFQNSLEDDDEEDDNNGSSMKKGGM